MTLKVTTNCNAARTSAAIDIGGPAVLGIGSIRPVTLRPRLSVGFALYDFAGLDCRACCLLDCIRFDARRNRNPVSFLRRLSLNPGFLYRYGVSLIVPLVRPLAAPEFMRPTAPMSSSASHTVTARTMHRLAEGVCRRKGLATNGKFWPTSGVSGHFKFVKMPFVGGTCLPSRPRHVDPRSNVAVRGMNGLSCRQFDPGKPSIGKHRPCTPDAESGSSTRGSARRRFVAQTFRSFRRIYRPSGKACCEMRLLQ